MNFKYILIIVILAILAVGGVLAYQSWWAPEKEAEVETPKVEVSKDETADWKVYRNEEYRYEIKYPHYLEHYLDLEITHPTEGIIYFVKGEEIYYIMSVLELSGRMVPAEVPLTGVYQGETVPIASLSVKDLLIFILAGHRCKGLDPNDITWKSIKMGDLDGLQANSEDKCAKQNTPFSSVIKNNRMFSFELYRMKGFVEEYNQMLSTFRFID